ncbi:MAG: spore cortex biosynthesis protein YabQ [Clostridium baratii]|uniref:spore cortex biosynthesis protein YabQ n=1 Tax=Clostridium baratii TaxID=1561 RepID=UPI00242E8AC6|nr:spore cortex biosynthesis protein YabQ [Clostridium baratii]MBS6007898.1 spore cortex biosynthesis protein YabQ [Clostridium baratii]
MPLELDVQFDIVIYALLAGLILGMLFDLYRMIRGKSGHKLIIAIQDILFWIFSSF